MSLNPLSGPCQLQLPVLPSASSERDPFQQALKPRILPEKVVVRADLERGRPGGVPPGAVRKPAHLFNGPDCCGPRNDLRISLSAACAG